MKKLLGLLLLFALPAAGIETTATVVTAPFDSVNDEVAVSTALLGGAGFLVTTANLSATLTPEVSLNGSDWQATSFVAADGTTAATIVLTGSSVTTTRGVAMIGGTQQVRVRVSAYTSGTGTATLQAGELSLIIPPAGAGGGLTDAQLRATPVPVSGTVTASGPLTDAQLRATPVPAQGAKSNNGAAPGATNFGVLPGVATAAPPTYTEGNQVAASFDLSGGQRMLIGNATATTTFNANGQALSVATEGKAGCGVAFSSSAFVGSIIPEVSGDGGATWQQVRMLNTNGVIVLPPFSNPASGQYAVIMYGSSTNCRLRVSAFTSGTLAVALVAGATQSAQTVTTVEGASLNNTTVGTGNPVVVGGRSWSQAGLPGLPNASASGNAVRQAATGQGIPLVTQEHPDWFQCAMTSTATTSTIITGCSGAQTTLTAPGAGFRIVITGFEYSSSIISTTANFMTLRYGTGGTCGTGITSLWVGSNVAAFSPRDPMIGAIPLKAGANTEVCFIHPGTGTRWVNVRGFIAPTTP